MSWKPVDYIAVAFTVTISFGLVVAVSGNVFLDVPLSDHRARLIEIVISAVLSIISMYVGAQIQKRRDKDDDSQI